MVLVLIYGETHWVPDRQMAYMGVFTVVVFGAIISEFRHARGNRGFWLALSGLFVAHAIACALLWSRRLEWRTIHYGVLSLLEIPMLSMALDRLGFFPGRITPRK